MFIKYMYLYPFVSSNRCAISICEYHYLSLHIVQVEVVVGKVLPSFPGLENHFWKVEKVVRPANKH